VITPYYRPQHRIFQNLRDTASNAVNRSGALVVGTQYLLALNDGRELPSSAFSTTGGNLFYRYIQNGVTKTIDALSHKVRLDSVKVFGKELEAEVATTILTLARDGADDRLRLTADSLASPTTTDLLTALAGRSVKVGDLFVCRADNETVGSYGSADTTYYRKVKALLGKKVAATVVATAASSTNAPTVAGSLAAIASSTAAVAYTTSSVTLVTNAIQKILEVGGRYNGKVAEEITLVCTKSGTTTVAEFSIAYTSLGVTTTAVIPTGTTPSFTFALTALGAGNSLTLQHVGPVAQGDIIRVLCTPVYTAPVAATSFVVSNATDYVGPSTSYVIEVVKGGVAATSAFSPAASLRVYDTNGVEPVQVVSLTTAQTGVAFGTRGLRINYAIPSATQNLATGDKFVVAVTGNSVSSDNFDGVVLDGPAFNPGAFNLTNGKLSVDVRQVFNGEITSANAADASAFTATASQVVYDPSMGMMVAKSTPAFVPFVTDRGTLTVAFKAGVLPGLVEGPIKVTSMAALSNGQLGELSSQNDLAYGAYLALSGSGNTSVSALRTSEDSVSAFTAALNKIRATDIYYAITPLTDSLAVANFVALHCEEMSGPEKMNFRRSYFGTDSPGRYTAWDTLSDGTYRKATLVGDTVTVSAAHEAVSNFNSEIAPVYVGDLIRFSSLAADLVITEITSSTTVRVSGAPPLGVVEATTFQLIKPDTADNTIDYVIGRSLAIANRRAINVWCDRPTALFNGASTAVSSKFLASEIAGLRSALRPQQGLTMTEITAVDEAPAMFARFTPEQLDRAAAAGVMIVTQEIEGGEIFIRHQLTTQTEKGALQSEDSPGVVVDTFSLRVKDAFRNYLGKKNVTPTTIAEIYSELKQLAIDASQIEAVNDDSVGALILGFSDESGKEGEVTVEVDGDLADKVRTFVNLRVALPLNGLTHYVDASASVTI
jgi:hypothetical protein